MEDHPWRSPATFLAAAVVLSFVGNASASHGWILRETVGAAAVVAIAVGVRRNRPPVARAWGLLAAGIALWVAGDIVWDWLEAAGMSPASFDHLADLLYLCGYPLFGAGVIALVRARNPRENRDGILDGAILAVAGVLLVWSFLIAPQGTSGSLTDQVLLAAYPLGDGLLLAGIAWLALTPGRRCPSIWLLGSSLVMLFVTDLLWNLASRFDLAHLDPWLNPLYPISYALIATAALHPSVRVLADPVGSEDDRVHSARLVFLGIALFVGPLVATVGNGNFGTADLMVTGGSLVVAALVVGRFFTLVRDNERAQRRFKVLAESSPVGIYEVGAQLEITFANAEADRLFGRKVDGIPSPELLALVDPADRAEMVAAAESVLAGEPADAEFRLHAADGEVRWVSWRGTPDPMPDAGHAIAFASTLDISKLKQLEEALRRQATHDPLTGLPNRRLLSERLGAAIDRLARDPATLAVLFVDLDRFKMVNDVLGHDAGDDLLVEIGGRIASSVRSVDTVARIGGDEFVVLCEDAGTRADLARLAAKIIEVVQQPMTIEGEPIDVGASIGIACASGRGDDAEALLRDADAAMYRAKANGRARYEFFDPMGTPAPVDEVVRRAI